MMNDNDMKSLWLGQQVPAADLSVVRHKIRYFRLCRVGEACVVIVLMALVIAFGLFIWMHWTPLLAVTKVGIVLLAVGCILPVLSYSRQLYLYQRLRIDSSNVDYTNGLLNIKRLEFRQQPVVLTLYFVLLSGGFGLYVYEYAFSRSLCCGIMVYVALLLWIVLNWIVIRPRVLLRRNRKFACFMKYIESHCDAIGGVGRDVQV